MAETPASYVETLRLFAERVFPTLGDRSYYQILNVPNNADAPAVRSAFYKLAGQLHPDRFHGLAEGEVKQRLETIYARICEAYRILSHPERRASYDQALATGAKRLAMVERESGAPRTRATPSSTPRPRSSSSWVWSASGERTGRAR
jgi:curved DNA-binding protein CbpA